MTSHDRRVARLAATALLVVTPIAAVVDPTAALIAIVAGGATLLALSPKESLA